MKKLVIIGGSNAFWEIKELIADINAVAERYEIICVLDDNPALIGKKLDHLVVEGPLDKAASFDKDVAFVFAIGSFRTRLIRKDILARLKIAEHRFETLVHPSAKIFSTAKIGNGCIIHYGSVVFNHSIVHSFSIVSANCVIGVSNVLGTGCLLGSNITTTTGVKIGSFAFVGSSVSIGEFVEVGPGAQIGMGSLLLKDITPGSFVLGNPPRLLDKVEVSENVIDEWNKIKSQHENT